MENLKIGIIAEGKSDIAVLYNVLVGLLGINRNQIKPIVPDLTSDETYIDTVKNDPKSFSNWTIVRQNCINKEEIEDFFNDNPRGQDLILIIQIDTAERFEKNYDVHQPSKTKDKDYSENLRKNIILKIDEWLDQSYDNLFYAIAIEETEAWLLTLIDNGKNDTSAYQSPKEKYFRAIQKGRTKKNVLRKKAFEKYDELSRSLRKNKTLKIARKKNKSLDLFCISLEENFE